MLVFYPARGVERRSRRPSLAAAGNTENFAKVLRSLLLPGCILLSATSAEATSCSSWPQFSSTEGYLEPLSVPAGKIGDHLSASPHMDELKFTSELRDTELWLDIVDLPGEATAAAVPRAIMMTGRLTDDSFDTLVLMDQGQGIFALSEPDLRAIGCQFIWGREGGQNPIALMRDLYRSMTDYPTGLPLSTAFNGSLMGDTMLAVRLNNEQLVPKWALSALGR